MRLRVTTPDGPTRPTPLAVLTGKVFIRNNIREEPEIFEADVTDADIRKLQAGGFIVEKL